MISLEHVKQRKLFQWGVAYLDAAWLVLQLLDLLPGPFAWPALVMRAATVLLAAGFVAMLVPAWYHGEPDLSYLALSPGGPNESGFLHAGEIGNLRLSNLKLVVLAACSTLNPRATRVGAAAGLAHSFLRAGAPAIVSSLWPVGDETTARLLNDFHRHYARNQDAAKALQFAQKEALKSVRPEESAVQNWAAFIYTGN